jgi:hypothetical protein
MVKAVPEDAPQVLFPEDDDVVEAVPSKGADDALAMRILPWGAPRGENFLNTVACPTSKPSLSNSP